MSIDTSILRGDELSRRQFAARTASAMLGVGLLPNVFTSKASAAPFEGSSKLRQPAIVA